MTGADCIPVCSSRKNFKLWALVSFLKYFLWMQTFKNRVAHFSLRKRDLLIDLPLPPCHEHSLSHTQSILMFGPHCGAELPVSNPEAFFAVALSLTGSSGLQTFLPDECYFSFLLVVYLISFQNDLRWLPSMFGSQPPLQGNSLSHPRSPRPSGWCTNSQPGLWITSTTSLMSPSFFFRLNLQYTDGPGFYSSHSLYLSQGLVPSLIILSWHRKLASPSAHTSPTPGFLPGPGTPSVCFHSPGQASVQPFHYAWLSCTCQSVVLTKC